MSERTERLKLIEKYRQEGMTYAQIGQQLGISRQRVQQIIAGNLILHMRKGYEMSNTILRNVNLRPEVYDLIQGECLLRRNGGKGFSLTLNQIVLEYFEWKHIKKIETLPGPEGCEKVTVVHVKERGGRSVEGGGMSDER